jgi:UDP-3-O-[3-hydroxymyristoyl] N-acetylglucosamine deacetylase
VEIPARLDAVTDTTRCTVLGVDDARVALVEHLLAALAVRGWWRGLVIEVSADELPILDGSAEPWYEVLEALGEPPAAPAPLTPEPLSLQVGRSVLSLEPGSNHLCAEINFSHPAIGVQRWCGGAPTYRKLLPARTFGFLEEAEALSSRGLARAADLENVIVFDSHGPLAPLRFRDEPVRHKALDVLGDMFLLAQPLGGRLTVKRGSHLAHIEFARAVQRCNQQQGGKNRVRS